uniref:Uncharacterized protein n=1 Tax=Megaselia scalaris TaxID=36166 RepID=T1G9Y7_MEGSC
MNAGTQKCKVDALKIGKRSGILLPELGLLLQDFLVARHLFYKDNCCDRSAFYPFGGSETTGNLACTAGIVCLYGINLVTGINFVPSINTENVKGLGTCLIRTVIVIEMPSITLERRDPELDLALIIFVTGRR